MDPSRILLLCVSLSCARPSCASVLTGWGSLCCPLMYTAFMWGVGADGSERACGQAAIVGIWAYVGTKWGNQCFLAERCEWPATDFPSRPDPLAVHIVYTWRTPRFKSRVFFGLVGVWLFTLGCGIYITVCCPLATPRSQQLKLKRRQETCTAKLHGPHQQCYMGFDLGGTLLILVATFAIDSALTAGFVLPLFRAGFAHARTLAVRSVIAAAVSLFGVLGSFLYIPLIGNEVRVWVMWLAVSCCGAVCRDVDADISDCRSLVTVS